MVHCLELSHTKPNTQHLRELPSQNATPTLRPRACSTISGARPRACEYVALVHRNLDEATALFSRHAGMCSMPFP